MFLKTLIAIAFLLTAVPAHACMMTEDEKQRLFESYDTSGDEALSQEEYTKGEMARNESLTPEQLAERFMATDTDVSGELSPDEFQPHNSQRKCL